MDKSRIILGCGNFGGVGSTPSLLGRGESNEEAMALLNAASQEGIRSFDTAHSYGAGASEKILGQWLRKQTAAVVSGLKISTKIGNPQSPLPGQAPLAPAEILRQLPLSLERLGLSCVDTVFFHEPDLRTPLAESLAALERALDQNQFRSWGLSNVSLAQMKEALAAASPRMAARLKYVQNEFHYLSQEDKQSLIPFLRARHISYCAFSPLAGGLLSGKYRLGSTAPTGSRLALRPEPYQRFLNEHSFSRIKCFLTKAGRAGPANAAIRFALAHADFAVIGPRNPEQLRNFLRGNSPTGAV